MPIQIRSFPRCILLLVCVYKGSFSGTGAVDIYIYLGVVPILQRKTACHQGNFFPKTGNYTFGSIRQIWRNLTWCPTGPYFWHQKGGCSWHYTPNTNENEHTISITHGKNCKRCTTKNEWKQNYTALTKKTTHKKMHGKQCRTQPSKILQLLREKRAPN